MDFPEGLYLSTVLEREEPCDAFVSNEYATLDELAEGAVVGTSSLRRRCQLLTKRPDLKIEDLRGNVNTRLSKLDDGQYDAIILACAGLIRLNMEDRIRQRITPEQILPAVGQGAIGLEAREGDEETLALVSVLDHQTTRHRVLAERALNHGLNGGCQVPIASHATVDGENLHLRALVGEPDGSTIVSGDIRGNKADAEKLGSQLANELLGKGAGEILDKLYAKQNDT